MILFRMLADWLETWPRWLLIPFTVLGWAVMVLHFLTWAAWRLGLLDEDDGEDADVVQLDERRRS
jgi:hypothetical protein